MLTVRNLLLILCVTYNEAARILAVIPTPAFSHQLAFRPYTQELARRGHQVTVITPIPAFLHGKSPENLTEIDVSNASFSLWERKRLNNVLGNKYIVNGLSNSLKSLVDIFESQIQQDDVKELIENGSHFDLLLLEAWIRLPLAFSVIFKAPVIRISSFGSVLKVDEYFGTPIHPILYPRSFDHRSYNLTLWEKMYKLYCTMLQLNVYEKITNMSNDMLKRNFGQDFPDLDELEGNNDLLLMNVHRFWGGNHPAPLNVVCLGGIHNMQTPGILSEELRSYLDSSENGVIYISFGTNVISSMLPEAMVETFFQVLSQLPYDVLWKWDKDKMPKQSKNIRVMHWTPQADLLRHPNLKLFISQAGLQSTDEAILAGVPLIGVPMLADQWFNAENYVRHGIGVMVYMDVSEGGLRDAIHTVLGDESYRRNIAKLRTLMHDQPHHALDRAVLWTERVLRARDLATPQPPSTPFHLELELLADVLLVCCAAILILATIVHYFIKFVLYYLWLGLKPKYCLNK